MSELIVTVIPEALDYSESINQFNDYNEEDPMFDAGRISEFIEDWVPNDLSKTGYEVTVIDLSSTDNDGITQEQFDAVLVHLAQERGIAKLLRECPEIYEPLREHLNNDILNIFENARED